MRKNTVNISLCKENRTRVIRSINMLGTPGHLIMDPVHGGISFFDHEKDIIDHPLFQRLRYIVQNDVLFFIFPGATHSRFQHCIGTMHLAGKLYESLIRMHFSEKPMDFQTDIPDKSFQYFYYLLRIAALLHDTGHFPFSHEFEKFKGVSTILNDAKTFKSLWHNIDWKRILEKQPDSLDHKHYSLRCALKILNDVNIEEQIGLKPLDIISVMEGSKVQPSPEFIQHARKVLSVFGSLPDNDFTKEDNVIGSCFQELFQVMLSGEVDVDKMDYLLRDSYFSGAHYGVYNLDHLISTLRIGYDLKAPWFGLAIVEKGIGALEDFINSRFQLYVHIYNHKAVYGFKYLLRKALGEVYQQKKIGYKIHGFLKDIEKFQYFTDIFVWQVLQDYAALHTSSYAARFINRKRITHLYSEHDMGDLKKDQWKRKFESNGNTKNKHIQCIYIDAPSEFSKIDKRETLRYLVRDPFSGKRELDEVKKHTKLFDRFRDIVITHFYDENGYWQPQAQQFNQSSLLKKPKRTNRRTEIKY